MKLYQVILFSLGFGFLASAQMKAAVPATRIIVIVNKDAITDEDLNQRIRLLNLSSGKPVTSPISEDIRAKVLDGMIEELLQLQAAKAKKIKVDMVEVEKNLEGLAKDNKMTLDQMVKMLASNRISKHTMMSRIKAQMAWGRYIRETYGALIHIPDQEVDKLLAQAKDVKIEELPVDMMDVKICQATFDVSPESPDAVKILVEQKIEETLRAKGCPEFLKAAEGLGTKIESNQTVKLGQLPGPLKALVQKATVGKCLEPMRTPTGLAVMMVCSKTMPTIAPPPPPTRQTAADAIEQEKLGKRAQQEMAKLKAVACIERK
jgi:parvulin-like peptidyl-prolyl isomerase